MARYDTPNDNNSTGATRDRARQPALPAADEGHLAVDVANGPGTTGSAADRAERDHRIGRPDDEHLDDAHGHRQPGRRSTRRYYFQYGTSPNYGATTASTDAGFGHVRRRREHATLSGLTPGATYHYRLVAKNSLGTDYGQDATFTTNAAPIATTGRPPTVSATSESLAGTVNPNGVDTTYYFEWGTSAAFGNKTAGHRRRRR